MFKLPYARVMAWLAGPISILAGYGAAWLVVHVGVLSTLGYGKDKVAAVIVAGATFVVGAAVTYLAHAKWFGNMAAWWRHLEQQPSLLAAPPAGLPLGSGGSNVAEGGPPEVPVDPKPAPRSRARSKPPAD